MDNGCIFQTVATAEFDCDSEDNLQEARMFDVRYFQQVCLRSLCETTSTTDVNGAILSQFYNSRTDDHEWLVH